LFEIYQKPKTIFERCPAQDAATRSRWELNRDHAIMVILKAGCSAF